MEENQELQTLNLEELVQGVGEADTLPPVELDVSDVEFLKYDTDEFQRGINSMSFLSGEISALLNTGVSESFVLDYLLNRMTVDHNIKIASMNNACSIEVAKAQKVIIEKNEL